MAYSSQATLQGTLIPSRFTLPDPRRSSMLPVMLAISVAVHAVLLFIKFVPPDTRLLENLNPPMEIVLVNSKSARKPTKADALAQANLDGGGNTEADRRAKSNLPVISNSTPDEEITLAARRVQRLENEVQTLMTRMRSDNVVVASPESPRPVDARSDPRTDPDTDARRMQIARLEAQIAKQWEHYQKLPKRKFIGARTEGVVYAQYVDDWRQKIERVGTHNFPAEAKRLGQYGSLLITVAIRADGSVEKVDIDRSSGFPVLDRAARRIVQLAAPFAPFPPSIRKDYDILSITRSWVFTKSDELLSE